MRSLITAALILLAGPALADPTVSLIGRSDFDVVACAGTPASVMDFSGGRQIMTFIAARSTGGIVFNGNVASGGRFDHSCEAIVQLKSGVVTDVQLKQHGGFITAGQLCHQVLAGCE